MEVYLLKFRSELRYEDGKLLGIQPHPAYRLASTNVARPYLSKKTINQAQNLIMHLLH